MVLDGFHSFFTSDQPGVAFLLASMFWKPGYSPMNTLFFSYVGNYGQKNMKLRGDGLGAFTFNLEIDNLLSDSSHLCFLCSVLSAVHKTPNSL